MSLSASIQKIIFSFPLQATDRKVIGSWTLVCSLHRLAFNLGSKFDLLMTKTPRNYLLMFQRQVDLAWALKLSLLTVGVMDLQIQRKCRSKATDTRSALL